MVATKHQASAIFKKASEMRFDIPYPVTVEDYFNYKFRGSDITRKGILIDGVDLVLQYIFAGIPNGSYIDDFWDTENDWLEGNQVEVVAYAEFPYGLKECDLIEDFYY